MTKSEPFVNVHLIEVFQIWAIEKNEPDAPWLVDSWDEYSIDGNDTGWAEAVKKARAENFEIRIVKVLMNFNAVMAAFQPIEATQIGGTEIVRG